MIYRKDDSGDDDRKKTPEIKLDKRQIQEMHEGFDEVKKLADALEKQRTEEGEERASTKGKLDEIWTKVEAIEEKQAKLQTAMNRPGLDTMKDDEREDFSKEAFFTYCRRGDAALSKEQLDAISVKALVTDDGPAGGYMMPTNMATSIVELQREMGIIEQIANVETISSGDAWETLREASGDYTVTDTTERGTRAETDVTEYEKLKIPVHEKYCQPAATQKMLDDVTYDIEGLFRRKCAQRFSEQFNVEFISGTGAGEPQGIVTHGDLVTVNSGHATELTGDGLIEVAFTPVEFYLGRAQWLAARATWRVMRTLKDGMGNYIWERDYQGGLPANLLGFPRRHEPNLATPTSDVTFTASTKPILFGDFESAYTVVWHTAITVIRDIYTSKPYTLFYTTRRGGGDLVLPEALVAVNISA